ncbi:HAMP domain-containing histidine kinase [Enterovirga sp. DB1703]|uniref:histidine kinase n=2 Tax=Enterovirga aerilata TaxID=2730920 RepID=A0A849I6B0_9HYPH|nr:HAMP domain-containing histidine kinase [Enterovirga sp. DB1703]
MTPHAEAPPVARRLGLSARLILLTTLFMMIAEVLIYVPSLANFRAAWIRNRVMGAQMIALALSAAPPGERPEELEEKLLAAVKGAQAIGVRGQGTQWLLATGAEVPPVPERHIDLRQPPWYGRIRGALRTLLMPLPRTTRIVAPGPPGAPGMDWVEILLDERPLREAMLAFTRQFLAVSLAVSGITSALLYLALHLLVVRPVRRLAANVTDFARNPEDASRIIRTSGRTDEIGAAEEALARMETALANELRQKRRLADLGLAVSKINHELRNMLTTAQLLSDRLGDVDDPAVQKVAPRLVGTLARAVDYCGATLAYGRASERPPQRRMVPVKSVLADQLDLTRLGGGHPIAVLDETPGDLMVDADPDQLGRVLLNLIRNAVEALARAKTPEARIAVRGVRSGGVVRLWVADNGPGVPDRVKDRLFSAFQASERSGGTGLGLPIAEELVRLHGGSIVLEDAPAGACFCITIPDRPAR